MVSINGADRQNVCRRAGNSYYYPDYSTALLICKKLHFHHLNSVGNTVNDSYQFRGYYSTALHYLRGCDPTCIYTSSPECQHSSYFTQISCGCSEHFNTTADGCIRPLCPAYKYRAASSVNCTQFPNRATSTTGADH